MNIVLVYNPKSGSALPANVLRAKCKEHGIIVDKLVPVSDNLRRALSPRIKKGATIAVVGGDGTLSNVAGVVADTKAVFAPLPGGTFNHFTKDLGISQDIDEALESLSRSKIRTVDVADVNGITFINNSSLGLYPSSLHARVRFEDRLGKWPAAVIGSMRAFVRFRTFEVTVDQETFHTPFVFVGNNKYDFDVTDGIARRQLDQGVLSVFIAHTTSRLVFLKMTLSALVGKTDRLDQFDTREVTALTIKARKKHLSVSRDGEISRMASPLKYVVRPGVLKIRY